MYYCIKALLRSNSKYCDTSSSSSSVISVNKFVTESRLYPALSTATRPPARPLCPPPACGGRGGCGRPAPGPGSDRGQHPHTRHTAPDRVERLLLLEAVLRIHEILGWIRIRILGSMPLTNGSGSGSGSWIRILLFSSLTFKTPAKNKFFNTIFSAYYFLKLHLHHLSKIKSQKEEKIVGIKVFLTILA